MFNTIRHFRERFTLRRAARNRDPDLMLHGVQNEFECLVLFLNSAAPDVAAHLRKHVEFDEEKHQIRYTGGPITLNLRRGKWRY